MNAIKFFAILILMSTLSVSCAGQVKESTENKTIVKSEEVYVYYFHNERRCATCKAVEAESMKAVKELYGEKVHFASYNLDNDEGEKMGEEIGTNVQALLIVSGDNKIDITNEGFMNARSNPALLKKTIKDKIDPLL